MMGQGIRLGCVALVAVAGIGGEPQIRREGAFWVGVDKGKVEVAAHGKIRVNGIGAITVKGGTENELSYVVVKRVKAATEAQARRLLSAYSLHASRQGDLTYLTVQGPGMADLELAAPRNASALVTETTGGTIDVSQFEGTVKVVTGGGRVSLDQIGGAAIARTAGGDVLLGKMGGDVRCTSGGGTIRADVIHGQAQFETGGGDIVVQQVDGSVRCSTAAGGIRITQAGDIVIADTVGGPIEVGYAKGMVTAKNSGGPIKVDSSPGATCESAGGAIHLTSVGGSLKASTAVGSIIARFQSQPVADSFLSTGSGDITLWIPSNLKITLHVESANYDGKRKIVSDFPAIAVKSAGWVTTGEGKLNGGGPLVRVAGAGGTIYVRRVE
ncbi:MAG TPA: hypothetical protein VLX58_02565 [Bryobacteraceae bacterium]|nr:hypothetical protein [Bryobacteraceae bacterium]